MGEGEIMQRTRMLLIVAGLLAASQVPALASGAVAFTSGLASGDVTDTGAILWTRVDQAAPLVAEVALDPSFQQLIDAVPVMAGPETDFTVKVDLDGLQPESRYFYRFVQGAQDAEAVPSVSATGTFRTAPHADRPADVRFAYSGDSEAGFQPFTLLDAVRRENPDFFVYLGDTIYADTNSAAGNVTQIPPAETLSVYRAKYRENRQDAFLQALLAATPTYAIWDDHEVLNDFAGEAVDPTLLAHGLQAFLEYMPLRPDAAEPRQLFRRFRWGRAVDLFILDERQYRSAERFCVRDGHLVLIPVVQDPRCFLTELAAPDRTMLGARQKAWLTRELLASEATFKVIINEVPMGALYVLPYDRWESYVAEREELLQFMRANLRNVIFLTTDLHGTLILEATPFLSNAPVAKEVIVGPMASSGALAKMGMAPLAVKAPRPSLGAPACVHLDTFSYGLVEVDSQAQPPQLTVTVKGQDGHPLIDPVTGQPCRITVRAEE
jgi:alkaline phosphatase D